LLNAGHILKSSTRSLRFTLCIVHQKKKMRARRARAETTMPRPTVRMTTALSGVRSEIDRLAMVKISSGGFPSKAPSPSVAIRERPARESGPSRGRAAPRRPGPANWGIPGRPFPSRTLRLRFLSPQKCPDKLQSKSSCDDPTSLAILRIPFDDALPAGCERTLRSCQNQTVSFI
jgi:hypothetical protein